MNSILAWISKYGVLVCLLLLFTVMFKTCSIERDLSKLDKNQQVIHELDSSLNSLKPVTAAQVDTITKKRLFEFMVYQSDLYRGRTSLSKIQSLSK